VQNSTFNSNSIKNPPSTPVRSSRRLTIQAKVWENGHWRPFTVRGQTARSLLALVEAGPEGRTSLEVSSWALRFAAYTHDLIKKHGLDIVTIREDHAGGWHGRHVLRSEVEIVSDNEKAGA
jgi:hypothetical protein